MDFKNLKKEIREPNVRRLLPNVCDCIFILCVFHLMAIKIASKFDHKILIVDSYGT
jgi:hypothetical protein